MKNNYEYVQSLKTNLKEQEKIKKELSKILENLLIDDETTECFISDILSLAIKKYTPNNMLPFQAYVKNILQKEMEKKYFTPSSTISIENQKIINLYLLPKNDGFLTEEEIRKTLQINSGTLYQAITKLNSEDPKIRKEIKRIYPDYKEKLRKRREFFKKTQKLSTIDLQYLGYYIGEIDDICLDIHDIAIKERKTDIEIQTILKRIFESLQDNEILNLVKKKYPNCEEMLKIKAATFGINLQQKKEKEKSESQKTETSPLTKEPISQIYNKGKTKKVLTEKQELLLTELAKNPKIHKEELAQKVGYKNRNSLQQIIYSLKKQSETNEELKKRILEIYPSFFTKQEKKVKKSKSKLTENEKKLLTILQSSTTPFPSYERIIKNTSYKSRKDINNKITSIKTRSNESEEFKQAVLKLYPNFFEKEKLISDFSEKQLNLLLLLKKHYTNPMTLHEFTKELKYKNSYNIITLWKKTEKIIKEKESAKQEAIAIHPKLLESEIKFTKKERKKKNQENHNMSASKKDTNLTEKEIQVLQRIYLITPPQTTYSSQTQIAQEFKCSQGMIFHIKEQALKKIEARKTVQENLQKIWPTFNEDKTIKEHYKRKKSIKIPSKYIEGIKTFIRQFDIPDNKMEKSKNKNPILKGIQNLENSIFTSYVSRCTEEQKAILALRLGYINAPATTETIAELFSIEKQEVITLTKNCLKSVQKSQIKTDLQKTYQKKN